MKRTILHSLKAHAYGHIEKSKSNVEIYLSNPIGIGEHSDVLEAINEQIDIISKYHDRLEVIDKYLKD